MRAQAGRRQVRIAVIGKGNVGSALGQGWRTAGHEVTYAVQKPASSHEAEIARGAADADIVVIATPWAAVEQVVADAQGLAGKTVIDCVNPLAMVDGRLQLAIGHTTSAGEKLAALAPRAFIFKTLNQTGAENLGRARRFPTPPVMYVAGDDAARKEIVRGLVRDLGFEGGRRRPTRERPASRGFRDAVDRPGARPRPRPRLRLRARSFQTVTSSLAVG
jgi:predicted dinucleotide-binding enzyme